MIVDGIKIDDDSDCYVIAEIGHNHQGDLEQCKRLFDAAHTCGAHAVKLQKRDNKTLFTKTMYESPYNSENAFGSTYGAHRDYLEFNKDQYRELQDYARKLGITFFSTAFDFNSADMLAELDMPAYKIASGDLTNIPLIKHVASIGKPVFLSTGGGTMEDVLRAYRAIVPINKNICIMQCTAGYPPKYEELNLRVIESYRKEMPDIVIGFSSHDNGIAMPLLAYMLGARAVEKHFTLDRAMKGTDHAFSLERPGLQRLVRDLKRSRIALGDGVKRAFQSEKAPLYKMGKKLVAARNLSAGHVLTVGDIAIRSPNDGLPPYEFESLIGRKLTAAVVADHAFSHDDFR